MDDAPAAPETARPLAGVRVGVTAARKVEEQVALLERRGADVVHAPALSTDPYRIDAEALRAATAEVLARPVDLFLGTTGIGLRAWFGAAEDDGTLEPLLARIGAAEVLARGPKTVGALRQRGLREDWVAETEEVAAMLAHLEGRDLTGVRVVVQEHGQSLSTVAERLRTRGADVVLVTVYRIAPVDDPEPLRRLVDEVVAGTVRAVTFTAAPAAAALLQQADDDGRADAVAEAFRSRVLAVSVGPVTADAFAVWDVPTTWPDRSRLAAMVRHLEAEVTR